MSAGHTPGPWVVVHQGGSSTVLCEARPRHNDNSSPSFGYGDIGKYCIARPFTDDDGHLRRDFVCFSHDDARLIAAAPELLAELIALRRRFHNACIGTGSDPEFVAGSTPGADAAIAKATGGAA